MSEIVIETKQLTKQYGTQKIGRASCRERVLRCV